MPWRIPCFEPWVHVPSGLRPHNWFSSRPVGIGGGGGGPCPPNNLHKYAPPPPPKKKNLKKWSVILKKFMCAPPPPICNCFLCVPPPICNCFLRAWVHILFSWYWTKVIFSTISTHFSDLDRLENILFLFLGVLIAHFFLFKLCEGYDLVYNCYIERSVQFSSILIHTKDFISQLYQWPWGKGHRT